MRLHIELGHPVTKDVEALSAKGVRFVTNDGRTMFDVSIGRDGNSIEVRGVEAVFIEKVLHGTKLAACPNASNSLTIRTLPYDD